MSVTLNGDASALGGLGGIDFTKLNELSQSGKSQSASLTPEIKQLLSQLNVVQILPVGETGNIQVHQRIRVYSNVHIEVAVVQRGSAHQDGQAVGNLAVLRLAHVDARHAIVVDRRLERHVVRKLLVFPLVVAARKDSQRQERD